MCVCLYLVCICVRVCVLVLCECCSYVVYDTFVSLLWSDLSDLSVPGTYFFVFWRTATFALLCLSLNVSDYHSFPQDTQQIVISAQSYGVNKNFVSVSFTGKDARMIGYGMPSPVSFITIDGVTNFKANPLWTYNSYSTAIYNPNYGSTSTVATKDTLYVYLNIARQSSGIIYRLAVPILLLLLLVGLTFWSDYTARVDTTITILLAISSLYIVIFSSIPQLGYLTDFDMYILTMFFLIVVAVSLHQFSSRLKSKEDRYPLRMLALRIIEIMGKVLVVPGVLVSFFWTFTDIDSNGQWRDMVTAVCSVTASYILLREWAGWKSDVAKALVLLRVKMEREAAKNSREDKDEGTGDNKVEGQEGLLSTPLTAVEIFFFNRKTYGIISGSILHLQRQLEEQRQQRQQQQYGSGGGLYGRKSNSYDSYSGEVEMQQYANSSNNNFRHQQQQQHQSQSQSQYRMSTAADTNSSPSSSSFRNNIGGGDNNNGSGGDVTQQVYNGSSPSPAPGPGSGGTGAGSNNPLFSGTNAYGDAGAGAGVASSTEIARER